MRPPPVQIELQVDPACSGTVAYVTVDGDMRAPFFQIKPYPALKINRVQKSIQTAPNTQVRTDIKLLREGNICAE